MLSTNFLSISEALALKVKRRHYGKWQQMEKMHFVVLVELQGFPKQVLLHMILNLLAP